MYIADQTVAGLRALGYAVVVFTPDEVLDADPRELEETLADKGNEWLAENTHCDTCKGQLSGTGDDYNGRCPSCADKETEHED